MKTIASSFRYTLVYKFNSAGVCELYFIHTIILLVQDMN